MALPDYSSEKLRSKVQELVEKYEVESSTTAIILIYGAYKDDSDPEAGKKQTIIQANNGEFLIIGSNSVYEPELWIKLRGIGLKDKVFDKLIISIPWFASDKDDNIDKFKKFWKSEDDLISYVAMPYDATQMLINAISKPYFERNKITRERVRNALKNTDIEGITGRITLDGSDRESPFSDFIKVNCSQNPCQWEKQYLDQNLELAEKDQRGEKVIGAEAPNYELRIK